MTPTAQHAKPRGVRRWGRHVLGSNGPRQCLVLVQNNAGGVPDFVLLGC